MQNEIDKLDLARALKDAAAKTAALPQRLRDEYEQAEAEGREPFKVEPLTEIRADLVCLACEAAAPKADKDLAAIIGVQRKACKPHGQNKVFIKSEQLYALLTAAGVSEGKNAPVQG